VDEIFKAAALAANAQRIPLAKMAVQETGMGIVEDKVIKNQFASEFVYNKYKDLKTCDVVDTDDMGGIQKVAEPVGIICGVVPTTNPTSTAIFKALIALKTRNAIVFSPHPRAAKSTIAAAKIVRDAAEKAGAPKGIINWLEKPTLALSQALMQHPEVKLILATGGPAMVHAAYSSGHPALGVGSGNTPAIIDETADIEMAVSSVLQSKSFDNGMICASEQSVVVVASIADKVKAEFEKRGAYFLTKDEAAAAGAKIILPGGKLNVDIVGQSVEKLAKLFGLTSVPRGARVLVGEASTVGPEEPWAYEKLSPLLGFYRAPTFEAAVDTAASLVDFAGAGHTSVLYTNPQNKAAIKLFESRVNTCRMLINSPAAQGAIGDVFNQHLDPSLTLGCGTWGDNSVSTNVTPLNLINTKTVASRRENMLWYRVPPKIYFKGGCLEPALRELKGKKKAFICTDKPLYDLGVLDPITKTLEAVGVRHTTFFDVEPDPTLATVRKGLAIVNQFQPDVIIAVGGGSPMDAAKIMWLLYESPDTQFEGLSQRFMDIRKCVYDLPTLGQKAQMICIPTTSGTGSEVTPFSVITDEASGMKYPLADYSLTPNVAICDPMLTMRMPKKLTAYGGVDAVTHALESYVSVLATEFTQGQSREALRLLFKFLPRAYKLGENDPEAREKVHYASTIAGMAFANAFLGICHSCAHKLGAAFHVPHGLANAALISHVVAYNATDAPFKMATFSQYHFPNVKEAYADLADFLGFSKPGDGVEQKVIRLIEAIEQLKKDVDIPATIKEIVGADKEAAFMAAADKLAEDAFDDQCTGANPRYPLINDLKNIYISAWQAPILPLTQLPEVYHSNHH
jgi:acetaldehyde dehydrogenase/alcohol dehydrogenase